MALQKSIEKDDLLTRMRVREVALFGLIAMAAILAQISKWHASMTVSMTFVI